MGGRGCGTRARQVPDELVPLGMSRSAYGNAVWEVGERGAQHLIGARTAAQLRELGLTVEKAQQFRSFYLHVFMRNPLNDTAGARIELMDDIARTLEGG